MLFPKTYVGGADYVKIVTTSTVREVVLPKNILKKFVMISDLATCTEYPLLTTHCSFTPGPCSLTAYKLLAPPTPHGKKQAGAKTSWGTGVKLGTLRSAKMLIALDLPNRFRHFKKGNCSEFDGKSSQSIAKAPK